jgi:hypothetical protein
MNMTIDFRKTILSICAAVAAMPVTCIEEIVNLIATPSMFHATVTTTSIEFTDNSDNYPIDFYVNKPCSVTATSRNGGMFLQLVGEDGIINYNIDGINEDFNVKVSEDKYHTTLHASLGAKISDLTPGVEYSDTLTLTFKEGGGR